MTVLLKISIQILVVFVILRIQSKTQKRSYNKKDEKGIILLEIIFVRLKKWNNNTDILQIY